MTAADTLALLDWKRRVFSLYAAVRALEPEAGWALWRETRDELFRSHPQSPLPADRRASFDGLEYWPYDPLARVLAELEDVEAHARACRDERDGHDHLQAVRPRELRASWRAARARGRVAHRLRRRCLSLLPRRDERTRELRRRPLPPRHGEGRGSRGTRRAARARLQLRLQPVLLLRPGLGLPAGASGQPAGNHGGGGEKHRS